MIGYISLLAAIVSPASESDDNRAHDAVDAFSQLCVGTFTDSKSDLDETRFSTFKLSDETVRQIKPKLAGQDVWDVSGQQSGVHMLVHYEPTGICVVEVAKADEAAMRESYSALIDELAERLEVTPERQEDKTNRFEGKDATTSLWRFDNPKRDILLAITTYPDPTFMLQHVMTINFTTPE